MSLEYPQPVQNLPPAPLLDNMSLDEKVTQNIVSDTPSEAAPVEEPEPEKRPGPEPEMQETQETQVDSLAEKAVQVKSESELPTHDSNNLPGNLPDSYVNGIFVENNTTPPTETKVFPLFSLKGKTAIVTGAGAGIGYAAAEAFAEAGANVAIWYNNNTEAVAKALKLSEEFGVSCKAYQVDVTNEEAVKVGVDQAVRDHNGRLDIFVANSGIAWLYGPLIGTKSADFARIIDTNFTSLYYCALAAGPHFQRQAVTKTDINGKPLENYSSGSFIATSSIAGHAQQLPQMQTPYNTTKAAMTHFCKGLAVEWVRFARVNIVSPGYISTEMLEQAPEVWRKTWWGRTPMGREGKRHEMKGAYLFLASDASSFATGTDLVVDGGISLL